MNMKIQYYNKIRWGLAPLAPKDAPPLHTTVRKKISMFKFSDDATRFLE
jgi:hypothetical protein